MHFDINILLPNRHYGQVLIFDNMPTGLGYSQGVILDINYHLDCLVGMLWKVYKSLFGAPSTNILPLFFTLILLLLQIVSSGFPKFIDFLCT
jgi:hypothetical protein